MELLEGPPPPPARPARSAWALVLTGARARRDAGGGGAGRAARRAAPEERAAQLLPVARALHHLSSLPDPISGAGDVRPANVLLTAGGVPKLANFRAARRASGARAGAAPRPPDSPTYAPPELWVAGAGPSEAGDVYSFGCTLYARPPRPPRPPAPLADGPGQEAVAGRAPWEGTGREEAFRRAHGVGERPPMDGTWPGPLRSLLASCWQADPARRPDFGLVTLESLAGLGPAPELGRPFRPELPAPPLVVDPSGPPRCLRSIAEALRRAAPGQDIHIRPGLYDEGAPLVLDRDVRLIASPGAVLECRAGPALHCRGPAAPYVSGLAVRGRGARHVAVFVSEGSRARLDGVEVTSEGLACIEARPPPPLSRRRPYDSRQVRDPGTRPQLRGCGVRDGPRAGVLVRLGAEALLEACDVRGCARAGVEVCGARPTLRACRISGGAGAGVFVHCAGGGLVEGCTIEGNRKAGVEVAGEGACPTLRGNAVRGCGGPGIAFLGGASGAAEENAVAGCGGAGFEVDASARPLLRGNTLDGREFGPRRDPSSSSSPSPQLSGGGHRRPQLPCAGRPRTRPASAGKNAEPPRSHPAAPQALGRGRAQSAADLRIGRPASPEPECEPGEAAARPKGALRRRASAVSTAVRVLEAIAAKGASS
eukprot:tig00020723_g13449.t1